MNLTLKKKEHFLDTLYTSLFPNAYNISVVCLTDPPSPFVVSFNKSNVKQKALKDEGYESRTGNTLLSAAARKYGDRPADI